MSDEHTRVPGEGQDDDLGQAGTPVVDDWASAFATLEGAPPAAPEAPAAGADGTLAGPGGEPGPAAPVPDEGPDGAGHDATVGAGDTGGPVPPAGDAGAGDAGRTAEDLSATVTEYRQRIERQAVDEIAQAFFSKADEHGNKLIRQSNGQLGATINDPDIYQVDPETGIPTFYNPDTGRPFTGDNPRAQAKEWVDQYNEELRDAFNRMAEQRKSELDRQYAPMIQLLEFVPKYEQLDPVRQKMFDALISGYEILDQQGKPTGYSIDLNKALEQVNRQVAAIQASRPAGTPPAPPKKPALDTPTVRQTSGSDKPFSSLAEALEAQQDALLQKNK